MDKRILEQYMDAEAVIKETEQDIERLRTRRKTSVKGSMHDFPYAETHFRLEGTSFTYEEDGRLREEERLLEERKDNAKQIKLQVQQWMNSLSTRMQRIIRYKFFEEMSWEQVADQMGRKATGESIRKEFNRFLEEK